jgi:hypothetical protein
MKRFIKILLLSFLVISFTYCEKENDLIIDEPCESNLTFINNSDSCNLLVIESNGNFFDVLINPLETIDYGVIDTGIISISGNGINIDTIIEPCEDYEIFINEIISDTTDYEQLEMDSIYNSLGDEWFIDSLIIQINNDIDSIKSLKGTDEYWFFDEIYMMNFHYDGYYMCPGNLIGCVDDWFWNDDMNEWQYFDYEYTKITKNKRRYFKCKRNSDYSLELAYIIVEEPEEYYHNALKIFLPVDISTLTDEDFIKIYLNDLNIYI